MIGILLNIIGITIVVLSLFFISRTLQHERELYEEIKIALCRHKGLFVVYGEYVE